MRPDGRVASQYETPSPRPGGARTRTEHESLMVTPHPPRKSGGAAARHTCRIHTHPASERAGLRTARAPVNGELGRR
jgi:hypothetical protein